MISRLKYLQPTHYFALKRVKDGYVFPSTECLNKEVRDQLVEDSNYISDIARRYDLSWQAVQMGYVGEANTYDCFKDVPIQDEYHFLNKYFNKAWVFYVLIMRLLTFNNPIIELTAYFKANSSRVNGTPISYEDWKNFNSNLVTKNPKISVIIPTLNRYKYLKKALDDLEQQDYKNFDIIVVDQSDVFDADVYNRDNLKITVIQQKEKALWLARNEAIKMASSELLLFFDDDSRVGPDWIYNHLKGLDYFKSDISAGVSISKTGAKVPPQYAYFRLSDQLDTGNALIKKDVFRTIGLYDRQFEKQRMGDGEFGLRAFLNGYCSISNPYAKRLHLKVGSGGLREMGSWDAFRTNKWLAPRPIPSVLYFYRRYFGNQRAMLAIWRTVPLSLVPYKYKRSSLMLLLGSLCTLVLFPLIGYQVYKSWKLATVKLKEGPLIEPLI